MKLVFLIALGLVLGSIAYSADAPPQIQAEVDKVPPLPNDPFSTIDQLFKEAALPTAEEIHGWFTGRCYSYIDRVTPMAALLVGVEYVIGANNGGPLFSEKSTTRHGIVQVMVPGSNYPASYWDDLTAKKENEAKAVITTFESLLTIQYVDNGSLVSHYDGGNIDYKLRKKDNFYLEATASASNGLKPGEPAFNCYFFKRVHP